MTVILVVYLVDPAGGVGSCLKLWPSPVQMRNRVAHQTNNPAPPRHLLSIVSPIS